MVTVLDAGKVLGLWCLAGQVRRTVTATAMAPTTVRVIPKEQMLRLLRTEPAFSEYFISFLLKRNIQIGQKVIDLLFDPSERRLIRTLLFLAQFGVKSGDDVTLARVPARVVGGDDRIDAHSRQWLHDQAQAAWFRRIQRRAAEDPPHAADVITLGFCVARGCFCASVCLFWFSLNRQDVRNSRCTFFSGISLAAWGEILSAVHERTS